ncbi:preprotein translocase subunit SecG [Sphingobacterium spiritivorum]|uniref:Protein-export membrane protein SecG n=1 Tax=Sphingobacterium spiritivorum TaxID=258 RepID=A0A380C276_SPHSI|nr:preprotein translocase subunit SecG [Sphingobacterium spiritivorum]SUJ11397.1 preprotein translocase subunit SecG [Sphingobacterium spiritivorum]
MQTLLIVLIILTSVLLALMVLIQNPKGGGLSSGFSGGSNLMGVKRTGDFLEKGTWTLVIALMVFCLAVNILGPSKGGAASKGGLSDQIEAPAQQGPLNLNPTQQQQQAPAAAPGKTDSAK